MRVAVFGAGAIGAFYGARMADGGAEVSVIARGSRLDALRDRGLTIVEAERTTTHRLAATADPAEIGPVDVVLFCVKSYDTASAAAQLGSLLHDTTAVVSLQNGVDNEETIATAVGWEAIVGGSAYILAAVREPGVVTAAGPRSFVIGEWSGGPPSPRVEAIVDVARLGGVNATTVSDIRAAKWEKFTLLVAFAAMSASVRLGLGEILASPEASAMLRSIMAETWSVGRACGVRLDDDLVDRQFALLSQQAASATASLHHDLVSGHRMETEALQGAVVRLGRDHGVPTPFTSAAYAILDPWTHRNAAPADDRAQIPA